jgi:WD40 repeat protein
MFSLFSALLVLTQPFGPSSPMAVGLDSDLDALLVGEAQSLDPRRPVKASELSKRLDVFGDPLPQKSVARLGTIRLRCGTCPATLSFSHDSQDLGTVTKDGGLSIWRTMSGQLVNSLPAGSVCGVVAAASNLSLIAIASSDNGIWLLDLKTARRYGLRAPGPEALGIRALSFSGNSRRLISLDSASTCAVWDVESRTVIDSFPAFSEATGSYPPTLSSNSEGTIIGVGRPLHRVVIRDTKARRTIQADAITNASASPIALSPDGRYLAVFSAENIIQLWDVSARAPLHNVGRRSAMVTCLLFSADGAYLASGGPDSFLRLWHTKSGILAHEIDYHGRTLAQLAFSLDSSLIASAGRDNVLRIFKVASGQLLNPRLMSPGPVGICHFAEDSSRIVSTDQCHSWYVWDSHSGLMLKTHELPAALVALCRFSPTGKYMARRLDDGSLTIMDTSSYETVRTIEPEETAFTSFCWSCDGSVIVTAQPAAALLPIRRTKRVSACVLDSWSSSDGRRVMHVSAECDALRSLSLSSNRKLVVGLEGRKSRLVLIDLLFGDRTARTRRLQDGILCYSVFPSGRRIAYVSQAAPTSLIICESATGEIQKRMDFPGVPIRSVSISGDGRRMAVGSENGPIHIIDALTGETRSALAGHQGAVGGVAFSRDGRRAVSWSDDTTGLVWDLDQIQATPVGASSGGVDVTGAWRRVFFEPPQTSYEAVRALAQASVQACAWLERNWKDVCFVDGHMLTALIDDLDNDSYHARLKAVAKLRELGEIAYPSYVKKLAGKCSPELKRAIEQLMSEPGNAIAPVQIRFMRAMEFLEIARSVEALRLVKKITEAAQGTWFGREAGETWLRLRDQRESDRTRR